MKVRSIGFTINNNNKNINTVDVMNAFINASNREHSRTDYTRKILISDVNDFYYGLVVKKRTVSRNLLMVNSSLKLKIFKEVTNLLISTFS